ncbi:MAG: hypothetical protein GX623_03330 [Clostridiales bacterium]|nr:hypothetical protein [Clostridiales bacterium]
MKDFESKLMGLFDYQRFAQEEALAALILETQRRWGEPPDAQLAEEQLELNAAGEPFPMGKKDEGHG